MSSNPRPIGKIEATLLNTDTVKTNKNYTTKDIYSSLFGNFTNLITTNQKEYLQLLGGVETVINDTGVIKQPVSPKYLVTPTIENGPPSLTLLGNAVICTPMDYILGVENRRATLDNLDIEDSNRNPPDEVSFGIGEGAGPDTPWVDSKDQNFKVLFHRSGNLIQKSGLGGASNEGRSDTTENSNVWICANDFDKPSGFKEEKKGIVKFDTANVEAVIISSFQLQKNQPFAMLFNLEDTTPEQQAVINNFNNLIGIQAILGLPVFKPKVQIEWADFKLICDVERNITLYYKGKQIGETQALKVGSKKTDFKLSIYPLGECLYVYAGNITTQATIANEYTCFNLKEPVNTTPSLIKLTFFCGKAFFNFSPIVHQTSGTIISPQFGAGYAPDKILWFPTYLGKYGCGPRNNPISFPDKDDKNNLYDYLKNYSISMSLNQVGLAYTSEITINQPGKPTDFINLNKDIQGEMQNLQTNIKNEINSLKGGSQSVATTLYNTKNHVTDSTGAIGISFNNIMGLTPKLVGASSQNLNNIIDKWLDPGGQWESGILGGKSVEDVANGFLSQLTSEGTNKAKNNFQKTVNDGALAQIVKNIYSPALYFNQFIFLKALAQVSMSPNPQINNDDVMSVSINQSVEEQHATITLNNKVGCGNGANTSPPYRFEPGKNNFCGIKPVQIRAGYAESGGSPPVLFTGYVVNRKYSRPSPSESYCTLECQDVSKRARETYASNLPFFDGWCHLAVMYYLAREAGYSDNQILLSQDPRSGGGQRLRDLLQGDPDELRGGCFEGHLHETPPGIGSLSGDYLHQVLPSSVLFIDEAIFNFALGTPIWNCMQRIREVSLWYLYANNFGNLIYGPPPSIVTNTGKVFKEADINSEFNEMRRLDVTYDTAETRNFVEVMGQQFLGDVNNPEKGTWGPIYAIAKTPGFPNNIGDHNFAPWERMYFQRNPKFESSALLHFDAQELLRRCSRVRGVADYSSWGQPTVFPYDVITIDESLDDETGLNSKQMIVAAHTFNLSSNNYQPESSFSVESFDPIQINYDPNLMNRE